MLGIFEVKKKIRVKPKGVGDQVNKTMWLCAVLLAATQLVSAQAPSAVPVAEQQAKGWLSAFNSGDKATLQDFLQKYRPSDLEHLDGLLEFRAQTGGFELMKTEESTSARFSGLVKERNSDQFARIEAEVEPEAPIGSLNSNCVPFLVQQNSQYPARARPRR